MVYFNKMFETEGISLDNNYEIIIDFKNDDNVICVLSTLLELQDGLEKYNKAITDSISSEISVSTILVDIEKGSIKLKLHDMVKKLPSDKAIERYVDEPKNIIKDIIKDILKKSRDYLIDVTNDETILQIEKENILFENTKLMLEDSKLSSYGVKVSKEKLLKAADAVYKPIRESKNEIYFKSDANSEARVFNKNFEVVLENTFKETTHTNKFRAKLIIKKPALIGNSKWEVVYNKSLDAEMLDNHFMGRVRNREVPILSGDMLDCEFKSIITYNDDFEVVDSKYYILEVYDIIPPEDDTKLIH